MKIALDVMGGDNAPDINMDGAKRALQDFPLIEKKKSILWGREEVVRSSCDRWGAFRSARGNRSRRGSGGNE